MKLINQLQSINASAVTLSVARAFLAGYLVPFGTMILPQFLTPDYVGAAIRVWQQCAVNPAWLDLFFRATLNSGIAFALGDLMKTNAFDPCKTFFASSVQPNPQPGPGPADNPK